ncbi:hypothetical protein [Thauera sp. SDU_THAU2]|uniref:hypothetical protein n=1 Tax=Thauera sp. SDU_THAU2 TaxID=3136633 RepID=UPI00311DF4B2
MTVNVRHLAFGLCLLAALAIWLASFEVPALFRWPQAAILPLGEWLNGALIHLLRETTIGGTTITEVSRFVAETAAWPVTWLIEAMNEGHFYDLSNGGEFWLAPPPALGVALALVLFTHALGGKGPAVMAIATFAFTMLLGLWPSTLTTLIAVLFSVLVSVAVGVLLGIWACRSARVSAMLSPVYDSSRPCRSFPISP